MRHAVVAREDPASQLTHPPPQVVAERAVADAEGDRVGARLPFDLPSGRLEHVPVGGGIRDPPLAQVGCPLQPGERAPRLSNVSLRSIWFVHRKWPVHTDRIASRARIGSRRCSSRLPHTTTSNSPTDSGMRSYALTSIGRTFEPRTSRAIRRPSPLSGPASACRYSTPCARRCARASPTARGPQGRWPPPRRRPAARARTPESRRRADVEAALALDVRPGHRSTIGRRSNQPGVTTPGATSIVWYQNGLRATWARASSRPTALSEGVLTVA